MTSEPKNQYLEALFIVLRGIGQIVFQESPITGLLFVIGICIAAPLQAAGIVAGAAIGTITAWVLKYDKDQIKAGIYGFNPALVGIATLFFFQPSVVCLILLVVGCVIATVVTMLMRTYLKFPTYTTPFILTTWLVFLLAPQLGAEFVSSDAGYGEDYIRLPFVVESISHGVGQIMFQGTLIAGLCFLLGIGISNWQHAAWVLAGSVVGMLMATYHIEVGARSIDPERLIERTQFENIALGLYGYNATLAAVALFLWRPSVIPPILGMILTVPLTEFLPLLGVPALTAPFVIATWIVLGLGQLDLRLFKSSASPVAS